MKSIISIFISISLFSCIHTKTLSKEPILNNEKNLEIRLKTYRHKGTEYQELYAIITDKSGKYQSGYYITPICGCIRKYEQTKGRMRYFKLSTESKFDKSFDGEDSLVMEKFKAFPNIESFCSKSVLDSVKGLSILRKE